MRNNVLYMNTQGCVLAIKYDKLDFDIRPVTAFLRSVYKKKKKNPRACY